ncbi:MAG: hypothetical protein IIZ92_03385 [Aquincola sp.]|nr:hypothetical protein [Aquincola sp.]
MSVQQIETATGGAISATKAMREARQLGLTVSKGRGWNATWSLTDLRRGYCAGRYRVAYPTRTDGTRHGKRMRLSTTWLASLPVGVRLRPEWTDCAC